MTERVLITGVGGKIGRRLARLLTERGCRVVGVSRTANPTLENQLACHIVGDLSDSSVQQAAFEALGGEKAAVVHLAGVGSVGAASRDPQGAFHGNVSLTHDLLACAARFGVERFLLASTGLVYGATGTVPVAETALPSPRSIYAATKLAAESLLAGYAAEKGFCGEIVRFANVYGPDSGEDTVVGRIVAQMRQGREIEVASLAPVRDFVFVEDAALACARLLETENAPGCVATNVSSGIGTSIRQLVEAACVVTKQAGRFPQSAPGGGDDCLILANQRLLQRTGWTPQITLTEGLSRCLTEF